ncbi:DNA polymerase IV [Streptacidiphilus sp. P02-A3a]|uniref:DNA polymerase IV n=1 Tax=Streptacidiphilus sp. P02-A3a TaxID=2704468 RepID=UPI0015FDDD76|nr:DNA polymerase IV [Streptacidiphilus sp. P02-A3a]QMU69018.1 DNA polymerase IV [Streptacidiphilus sp. P02-A3a]
MRSLPSILHLDMDAFFASVEQASKPSLRGKPVVVGGLSGRGVVATASYEARRFGVHSAMPMAQARRLCPNAAFLVPRFELYRQVSDFVMGLLRELSPLVEPLSVDEAFVDLEAGPYGELLRAGAPAEGVELVRAVGEDLRADILTGVGLTASVGLSGTKFLSKIASEQAKPDGLVLIEPGREREILAELPVRALPGVGPATAETLRRVGLTRISEVARTPEDELVRLLGRAHGAGVHALALGRDERPVVAERDAKSVSVEDTFEVDLADVDRIRFELDRLAARCVRRLRDAGRSGRTVVIKVRRFDFTTLTRSETLPSPTDDPLVISAMARRLLAQVELVGGVRLLGVGVSGLADFTQEDLFAQAQREAEAAEAAEAAADEPGEGEPESDAAYGGPDAPRAFHPGAAPARRWMPGQDVTHTEYGPGWVQGSGVGRVTVRFEVPGAVPGRVRTFAVDDPELTPASPLPLSGGAQSPAADSAAPR